MCWLHTLDFTICKSGQVGPKIIYKNHDKLTIHSQLFSLITYLHTNYSFEVEFWRHSPATKQTDSPMYYNVLFGLNPSKWETNYYNNTKTKSLYSFNSEADISNFISSPFLLYHYFQVQTRCTSCYCNTNDYHLNNCRVTRSDANR